MKKDENTLVREALLKRATGYDTTETVDEFVECEGEIKLVKRRISTKNVPPDVTAAKLIMEQTAPSFGDMSDEELLKHRQRLMDELKEGKNGKR